MIDLDRYKEILDTLSRNKTRSFLTGFGVFWGVFMLVALIGGGKAMKESLSNELQGFATNSAIIFPQATTDCRKGVTGVWFTMMWSDSKAKFPALMWFLRC